MNCRPQRSDASRNRDRLLGVAADAFARDGVDASLERIARAADVGIGTLYRHFPTRDALIEAVYRHNVDALCAAAEELTAALPPDEALGEWMQRLVAYGATKKGLAAYLKSVAAADSDLFESAHTRVLQTLQALVAAAAAAGAVRADIDPGDLLRALGGVCLMADDSGHSEQGARLAALLMDGLRYQPRPAATTASRLPRTLRKGRQARTM